MLSIPYNVAEKQTCYCAGFFFWSRTLLQKKMNILLRFRFLMSTLIFKFFVFILQVLFVKCAVLVKNSLLKQVTIF